MSKKKTADASEQPALPTNIHIHVMQMAQEVAASFYVETVRQMGAMNIVPERGELPATRPVERRRQRSDS